MGDALEGYRREIDVIEGELIGLLERRMDVVRKVADYKRERGLPVLQADREREVLGRAAARLKNKAYADAAVRFMETVMSVSRRSQARLLAREETPARPRAGRVGYPGVAGSFSEQAAADFFGESRERRAYEEFGEVCEALRLGEIDYGVLPIENSSTGGIAQVYDLLGRYGFSIVGERRVRVSQNLAGVAGASLEDVRAVYSHSQGFEQSAGFLAGRREWERVPLCNTAVAAKYVSEEGDPAKAAICSRRAAALYGLSILAPDIQDARENATRFIVIGREPEPEGADKVSVSFSLDHEAGTLYNTLRHFAERGINLVKIESRPVPDALWHYLFYLDFEGDIQSAGVKAVLEEIAAGARDFRVLGAYRSDKT